MKKLYLLLVFVPLHTLWPCPTCVGRLNNTTPNPFFSEEHYKLHTKPLLVTQIEAETENPANNDEEEPDQSEDLLP